MSSPLSLTYENIPAGFTLILPINTGSINSINWGPETLTDGVTTYVYTTAPTTPTTVEISGTGITSFNYYTLGTGQLLLTACNSFGTIGLTNLSGMFNNCISLTLVPSILPSNVTLMPGMFYGAVNFNQDISNWDVSQVVQMNNMLNGSYLDTDNYNALLNGWSSQTLQSGVQFGAEGLVYTSTGLIGRNILTGTYNWTIVGDAYQQPDTVTQNVPFSLSYNNNGLTVGNEYQLYYLSTPLSDPVTFSTSPLNFTNLISSNSGLIPFFLLDNTTSTTVTAFSINVSANDIVCFKEGSKILTDNGYKPIETLRKGDLVKTLKHGYKPIYMIGKRDIYNPAVKDRIKDQLYKCSKNKYPELTEDLVITGCHSILVDEFTNQKQKNKAIEVNNGKLCITDNKYRLPACVDERASVYENKGNFTIYHIALENDDYYMNYGIYANGLLVETCSKRYLKELSNMVHF